MQKSPSPLFIILLAAAWILASGTFVLSNKVMYSGDEIISYLCATGHSADYEEILHQKGLYGHFTSAEEWKSFLVVNEPYNFKKIASDLCLNDIHPPLYFWLLHIFVVAMGVHPYTGIIFNIILRLCSLFLMFRLAGKLVTDPHRAAVACVILTISPACLDILFYARSYELLQLVTIGYFLNFLTWLKQPSRLNVILMVAIGAAGLLVHYTFMYVIATGIIYSFWRYKETGIKQLMVVAVSGCLAFGLMNLIHPCYADSFMLQHSREDTIHITKILYRILRLAGGLINFWIPVFSIKKWGVEGQNLIWILSAFSVVLIGIFFALRKKIIAAIRNWLTPYNLPILQLSSILIVLMSIPFVLFLTHEHAAGGQYQVYLYPFMAMLMVQTFHPARIKIKSVVLGVMFVGCFSVITTSYYWNHFRYSHLLEKLNQQNTIVVNTMDRRAFPRFIPYLKNEQTILMDEKFNPLSDTIPHISKDKKAYLFISNKEFRNEFKNNGMNVVEEHYPLLDGIDLYVSEITSESSSVLLPSK